MRLFTTYGAVLEIFIGLVSINTIKELLINAPKEFISVIAGRTPKNYENVDYGPDDPVKFKWHKVKVKVPLGTTANSFIYYTSVRMNAEQVARLGLTPIEAQKRKELKFKMMEKLKGH